MRTVTTEKELGEAIRDNENSIVIEGDLSQKIVRIKAVGPVAWAVCIGCLGIAIAAIITMPAETVAGPATGGISTAAHAFAAAAPVAPAAAVLGGATIPAITIGVAAGGVGGLSALYSKYRITKTGSRYIELKRR